MLDSVERVEYQKRRELEIEDDVDEFRESGEVDR